MAIYAQYHGGFVYFVQQRFVYGLLFAAVPPAAVAQDIPRVSLEEALQLFAERNLELRLARAGAAEVDGRTRQRAAFPNPVAYATHESLGSSGISLSETYVGLNQEISWPWRQSAINGVATHTRNAARAEVAVDSLRLAFEVKRAYTQAGAAEELHDLIVVVRDVFRDVERASTALFEEGDISGYDLRRVRMELARYETIAANENVEMHRARRQLARLVFGNAEGGALGPATPLAELPPDPPGSAENLAMQRRPELTGAREAALAAAKSSGFARASRLPNPTVTGAYTSKTGGFSGLLLGLSWPVPLFDGNGQAVAATEARLDLATQQEKLARQIVIADVRNAVETFEATAVNATVLTQTLLVDHEHVLTIADASYREGEMSLLALLDAAEAYADAGKGLIDVRLRAWIAYFDLERAVGGFAMPSERRGDR